MIQSSVATLASDVRLLMPLSPLHYELAERFSKLDGKPISAPIELGIGEYAFYPYRGYSDISQRDDFRKLSQSQLKMLIKIADDILNMQRTELFEAFVNDDGIIVIDKAQKQIEYSIDIAYNAARSRVEDIYPQVTYPQTMATSRVQDLFVRNDTAHEVAHHADYWLDLESKIKSLDYLHSSSTLLRNLKVLDEELRPDGVAQLISQVRMEEGYVSEALLEEGYDADKVQAMLNAEFFAIACEFYYGSVQPSKASSPLLEAYMLLVLDLDLDIQTLYIPLKDMEARRGVLRKAIHADMDEILGEDADSFQLLYARLRSLTGAAREDYVNAIEIVILRAVTRLVDRVREQVRLPRREGAFA